MNSLFKIFASVTVIVTSWTVPAVRAGSQPSTGLSIEVTSSFDYPGEGNSTAPVKINDLGEIAGYFIDASGTRYAFIRSQDGTFSPPLTDPHDTQGYTSAYAINNSHLVAGDYLTGPDGLERGFFLHGKSFTSYLVPGAESSGNIGLNNAGDFCGKASIRGVIKGFVNIGGVLTTFSAVPHVNETYALQVNDAHQICGYYLEPADNDRGFRAHGFYVEANGTIHPNIDPAGSTDTDLFCINDQSILVGRYTDGSGIIHGMVFLPPARFFTFDYPDPDSTLTSLNGINARNQIVGYYADSAGLLHGFTALLRIGTKSQLKDLPLAAPSAVDLMQSSTLEALPTALLP